MKYSFDTSSLSNAWYNRYPPDVFPIVWENLSVAIENGLVVAHLSVIREIEYQGDELYRWVKERPILEFPSSEEVQRLAQNIQDTNPKIVRRSARIGADPFVIAIAKQQGYTAVSEETETGKKSKIEGKIPFVCKKYDVKHINFLQFMREMRWMFR